MVDGAAETLYGALSPVVAALGLDLVDVELSGTVVRISVDRPGGVDLDGLADANRAVSAELDRTDPMPGRYTLEVSSPGVERRLRTAEHFARAVGETVAVRLVAGAAGSRRIQGRLTSADADGIEVEGEEVPGGSARIAYDRIERARTVFEWGAKPAPSPSRGKGSAKASKASKAKERVRTS